MRQLTEQASVMITAREKAERLLEYKKRLFIGMRYEPTKSGNLKGTYQITNVGIGAYDGCVRAWGRKVLIDGRLGERHWELGAIHNGTVWK